MIFADRSKQSKIRFSPINLPLHMVSPLRYKKEYLPKIRACIRVSDCRHATLRKYPHFAHQCCGRPVFATIKV